MTLMSRVFVLAMVLAALTADAGQWSYQKQTSISVTAASTGFTSADINGAGHPQATMAYCVPTVDIWYTTDGTTPVASSAGMPVSADQPFALSGNDTLTNFRATRDAGDGTIFCTVASK